MHDTAQPARTGEQHPHPKYMKIWLYLTILTVVEFCVAMLIKGDIARALKVTALVTLFLLACWKAGLVGRHFMHLAYEVRLVILVAIFPLATIASLAVGLLFDLYL